MSNLPRFLVGVALAAALAAGVVTHEATGQAAQRVELIGVGSITDGARAGAGATSVAPDRLATAPFDISGSVAGLFPGAVLPLTLSVSNPYKKSMTVVSLTTTVGKASAKCGKANLVVSAFAGQLLVAAGQTASLTVTATMPHSTGDTCQGASFPMTYHAKATVS